MALLGPAAGPALATGPTDPGSGNPTCTDLNPAWTLSFKIDTGDLQNNTYTSATQSVETNWTGQAITLSNVSGNGQTFNWSSLLAVSGVLVKAGNDNHALYTYIPPVTSDTGLTHGPNQQGISHLTFCGAEGTTTSTTTTGTTTTGTTTEGGVLGATATPKPTPPPTDTLPTSGTPGGNSWRLALLAIAGLLATLLLLAPATPAKARRRR